MQKKVCSRFWKDATEISKENSFDETVLCDMNTLIIIGGIYCLAFAFFHLAFWRLFDWKSELPKLNSINRGVLQVLNIRLTYVFFVIAFFCFF